MVSSSVVLFRLVPVSSAPSCLLVPGLASVGMPGISILGQLALNSADSSALSSR